MRYHLHLASINHTRYVVNVIPIAWKTSSAETLPFGRHLRKTPPLLEMWHFILIASYCVTQSRAFKSLFHFHLGYCGWCKAIRVQVSNKRGGLKQSKKEREWRGREENSRKPEKTSRIKRTSTSRSSDTAIQLAYPFEIFTERALKTPEFRVAMAVNWTDI